MSVTIKFPSKPSEEDLKEFEKLVHKFAGVSVDNQTRVESLISKDKTPMEILACKYCVKFRHNETMKLITKKDREIKKKQKEIRKCRVCGCTDDKACPGGCHWVEDDLCSQCKS